MKSKATVFIFIALTCIYLTHTCFAADTTMNRSTLVKASKSSTDPNLSSNIITINALPLMMTRLGYEHVFFEHIGIGVDWSYYYQIAGNYYNNYGFDNGDDGGIYNDINTSYYKIGAANKFDGYLKLEDDGDRFHGVVKLFYSYIIAQNFSQIYFNSPTFNHLQGQNTDSSVTTFLGDSPSNKVYYRETSFNGWGLGVGLGLSYYIDKAQHFMAGIEFGIQNMHMPGYAKQPIFVNGIEYYYEYTPVWESRINPDVFYGHITFSYAF